MKKLPLEKCTFCLYHTCLDDYFFEKIISIDFNVYAFCKDCKDRNKYEDIRNYKTFKCAEKVKHKNTRRNSTIIII